MHQVMFIFHLNKFVIKCFCTLVVTSHNIHQVVFKHNAIMTYLVCDTRALFCI